MANTPPSDRPPGLRLLPSSWMARAGALATVLGLVLTALSVLEARWNDVPPSNRPLRGNLSPDYVTSDTCRACHPGNYASWHASFHRTMTQVASPENFVTPMAGLKLSYGGTDYAVERKGEKHYLRTKPQGAADSAFSKPKEFVLLTGSHNLQVFWLESGVGRALDQFPFAYIIAEKKWAPMVLTFLVDPSPKDVYSRGDWNDGCINCHTTQGRARPGPNGKFDSQVAEFGISCEACHSGGREHVEANRNPLRRFALHFSGKPDPTIANPGRMDGPTATLACGQCHSIIAFNDPEAGKIWDRQGGNFRPGHKDIDLRWIVEKNGANHAKERENLLRDSPHFFDNSYWGDGMVRVTGREMNGTINSPCYKGGKFSCLSCHEMHPANPQAASLEKWRTGDQMKPDMESDQACLQCHQGMKQNIAAHSHHAAGSSGSSCYNCHMPHTTYGLLRAIRSHTVSSPSVRESTELGRPNACNLCHLDRPLAWTADKLAEWYGQKSPALSADDRTFSAAAQWLLKGDAGQRDLIVWSMGWEPAQKASGREWFYPYLIFELNDPYAAVRFASWKSLQTLPGFEDHAFDYTIDDAQQKEELTRAYQKWWREVRDSRGGYRPETILDPTGLFQQDVFDRMLDRRNNRKVTLVE